jgi:alpha-D-ribose 1-methylphosphonate 5-triphosphate synthase subunit PhnG
LQEVDPVSAQTQTSGSGSGPADAGEVASRATTATRQRWMGVLAKARPDELADRWAGLPELPAWTRLRAPETGMVMTRGRIGGDGRRFNLGEVTVTRCTVRLAGGQVGHAYVMGRDKRHAERAAVLDALLQDAAWADRLETAVVRPLADLARDRRARAARKAGATKVDFTTVTRGDG